MLGRPGSGKSAFYRILSKKLVEKGFAKEVARLDDFPVLQELLDRDTEFKRHYRKEGGFVVTDFTILDDVLKEMNEKLKRMAAPGKIIFVEFARDRYSNAMKNFGRDVLERSLILYIYCPFEVCVERNVKRFKESGGKSVDDHIAPTDIMEKYYKYEDYEEFFLKSEPELKKKAPADVIVVRNERGGIENLNRELEKVLKAIQ